MNIGQVQIYMKNTINFASGIEPAMVFTLVIGFLWQ